MSKPLFGSRLWEWHRINMVESMLVIFTYLFIIIVFTILSLLKSDILQFILAWIFNAMIIISIIFAIGVIQQRKNMWLKRVPFENIMTINIIEKLLAQQGIHFRKLSLMGPIKSSPLKYVEIFELYNGALLIRLQKQTSRGTIIELGPITNTNGPQIELIKNIIDSGFQPQILSV